MKNARAAIAFEDFEDASVVSRVTEHGNDAVISPGDKRRQTYSAAVAGAVFESEWARSVGINVGIEELPARADCHRRVTSDTGKIGRVGAEECEAGLMATGADGGVGTVLNGGHNGGPEPLSHRIFMKRGSEADLGCYDRIAQGWVM